MVPQCIMNLTHNFFPQHLSVGNSCPALRARLLRRQEKPKTALFAAISLVLFLLSGAIGEAQNSTPAGKAEAPVAEAKANLSESSSAPGNAADAGLVRFLNGDALRGKLVSIDSQKKVRWQN